MMYDVKVYDVVRRERVERETIRGLTYAQKTAVVEVFGRYHIVSKVLPIGSPGLVY